MALATDSGVHSHTITDKEADGFCLLVQVHSHTITDKEADGFVC